MLWTSPMASVRRVDVLIPDRHPLVAIVRIIFCVASALCTTVGSDEERSGTSSDLECDNGKRNIDVFITSGTWSYAALRPANQNFFGECTISVLSEHQRSNSKRPLLMPSSVLLKVRWQRAGTVQMAAKCDSTGHYLFLMNEDSSEKSGTLCEYRTYYVWARLPVVIYMIVAYGYANSNFPFANISFRDVYSPINICENNNILVELQVGMMAYAFAPSSMFSKMSPNDAHCSMTVNYTLNIAANSSSDRLNFTVLSAPGEHSGWSILVNQRRLGDGDSLSLDSGKNLVVLYVYNSHPRSPEGQAEDMVSGFTAVATVLRGAVSTELPDQNLSREDATFRSTTTAADLSANNKMTGSMADAAQGEKNATAQYSRESFPVVVVACSCAAGAVVIAMVSALVTTLIARRHCRRCRYGVETTMATGAPPTQTNFPSLPSEALIEDCYNAHAGRAEVTMIDNELYIASLRH